MRIWTLPTIRAQAKLAAQEAERKAMELFMNGDNFGHDVEQIKAETNTLLAKLANLARSPEDLAGRLERAIADRRTALAEAPDRQQRKWQASIEILTRALQQTQEE